MRRYASLAVCVLIVCVTLAVGMHAQPEGIRRDHSRVFAVITHAPFHSPPCELLKRDWPGLHQRTPDLWVAVAKNARVPATCQQYQGPECQYGGKWTHPDAYPAVAIYTLDEQGRQQKRFEMVGYQERDREILAVLIQRAGER